MSDIRVLAAALSLGATIVSGCASGGGSGAAPGPTQVGEEVPLSLRSPAYDATEDSRDAELVWRHEVSHAEATYIALHFSDFDLPAGAELSITTQDGSRRAMYTLSGKQLPVSGTVPIKGFWATHMPGDTAVIELHSSVSLSEGAVALDRFARGLPAWQELAADLPDPSLAGETEAICSTDDSLEAKCYQSSESAAYDKSRAVARLLLNGTGGCTGWLVGDEGHLMTNEHCIGNASTAANTDYEFMAEGADCSTDCRSGGACPGTVVATSASVVRINASLDYALVKLPVNPIATYGFMQMRESGGQVGERIYIPQHPARWGKRIAMKDGADDAVITTMTAPACTGGAPVPDVGYQADTRGGSSGSPVLGYNDNLVVALHHCANCPNRGVPIDAIISDLQNNGALPNNAVPGGGGCDTPVQVDAGPDQTVCLGSAVTVGTPAQADHTYSWTPSGATSAEISVAPNTTTTYTVTATTDCGSASDSVTVFVDNGAGGGLSDDFEGGAGAWTLSGLWHPVTDTSCASPGASSGSTALYYGQDSTCNYNTGAVTTGSATSPTIAGLTSSSTLSFQYLRQVEDFSGDYDRTTVEVCPSGGSCTAVWSKNASDASANAWTDSGAIDLSAFAGQSAQIRFTFDSRDGVSNEFTGWLIDDVVVTAESSCGGGSNTAPSALINAPANSATFTEGQTVSFAGSASDAEDGDISGALVWTSSIDGNIGVGGAFSTTALSVGSHTITATAGDSGGLFGTDSITITVEAAPQGFFEDFEGDVSSWTTSGLWHQTLGSSCASPSATSGVGALYYGQDSGCTYDTGSATSGSVTSPAISGIGASSTLRFQYYRQVESFSGDYDRTAVEVSSDGGVTWTAVWTRNSADASAGAWTDSGAISLSDFAGATIQVRFRFDSVDQVANGFTGWFIDDVIVE